MKINAFLVRVFSFSIYYCDYLIHIVIFQYILEFVKVVSSGLVCCREIQRIIKCVRISRAKVHFICSNKTEIVTDKRRRQTAVGALIQFLYIDRMWRGCSTLKTLKGKYALLFGA